METLFLSIYVVSVLIFTVVTTTRKNVWSDIETSYLLDYNQEAIKKGKPPANKFIRMIMLVTAILTVAFIALLPVINTYLVVRGTIKYIRKLVK